MSKDAGAPLLVVNEVGDAQQMRYQEESPPKMDWLNLKVKAFKFGPGGSGGVILTWSGRW